MKKPRPGSGDRSPPSRWYLSILAASPVLLLGVFVYGVAVLALTAKYYDVRDPHRLVKCGGKYSRNYCHPKTHDAVVFDCTIATVALGFVAL